MTIASGIGVPACAQSAYTCTGGSVTARVQVQPILPAEAMANSRSHPLLALFVSSIGCAVIVIVGALFTFLCQKSAGRQHDQADDLPYHGSTA